MFTRSTYFLFPSQQVKRQLSNFILTCIIVLVVLLVALIIVAFVQLLIQLSSFYCLAICGCNNQISLFRPLSQPSPSSETTTSSSSFPGLKNVVIKTKNDTELLQNPLDDPARTLFAADESRKNDKFRCNAVKGRRILINYAQNMHYRAQRRNCASGLENGWFDVCIKFNKTSIDDFFQDINHELLSMYVLAGYAVWKPLIIYKTLLAMDEDDVLFYTDSGTIFVGNPERHICLMVEKEQDVVVFSSGLLERLYSKSDALLMLDCSEANNCTNTMQRMSGVVMLRKSLRSLVFISAWLTYNQDIRIISDAGADEEIHPDLSSVSFSNQYLAKIMAEKGEKFKANRHDQTVLSILSKRFKIPEWPDPTQYGEEGYNAKLKEYKEFESIRDRLLFVTRDKN